MFSCIYTGGLIFFKHCTSPIAWSEWLGLTGQACNNNITHLPHLTVNRHGASAVGLWRPCSHLLTGKWTTCTYKKDQRNTWVSIKYIVTNHKRWQSPHVHLDKPRGTQRERWLIALLCVVFLLQWRTLTVCNAPPYPAAAKLGRQKEVKVLS